MRRAGVDAGVLVFHCIQDGQGAVDAIAVAAALAR
jgi:hypothetical protein